MTLISPEQFRHFVDLVEVQTSEAVDLLDALDWNVTLQEPRDLLDSGLGAKVSGQNVLQQ